MNPDVLKALEDFVAGLGFGMLPLPPDPDTLDGHIPDFSNLARDDQQIIRQVQDDPNNPLDGGDSANREGHAAFCNSALDMGLLPLFEQDGIMVRHPTQAPWNNWKNCTRDQLLAYVAGCWRAKRFDINARLLEKHLTRLPPLTCQDTEADWPGTTKTPPIGDPLGPHDVMMLRIVAGDPSAYLDPVGQLALQLAIETSNPDVTVEKNQLILQSMVCGRLNLYVQIQPDYAANIRDYWSGWRKQPQIGEEMIWVITQELKRYAGQVAVPLLPAHVITLLKGLDLAAEIKNLDPTHHAQLAARFAEAALKDAANMAVNVMQAEIANAQRQLLALGRTVEQVAKALADIGQAPNAIRAGFETLGIPPDPLSQAMRAAFPGIPHVDTPAIPHVDVDAVPHADIAPVHLDAAPVHQDVAGVHVDASTPHTDATGPHTDFSVFGAHTDIGGIHADVGGIHTDAITTPHLDVVTTPHVDAITTPHVDTGPTAHVDTPGAGHIDTP